MAALGAVALPSRVGAQYCAIVGVGHLERTELTNGAPIVVRRRVGVCGNHVQRLGPRIRARVHLGWDDDADFVIELRVDLVGVAQRIEPGGASFLVGRASLANGGSITLLHRTDENVVVDVDVQVRVGLRSFQARGRLDVRLGP